MFVLAKSVKYKKKNKQHLEMAALEPHQSFTVIPIIW